MVAAELITLASSNPVNISTKISGIMVEEAFMEGEKPGFGSPSASSSMNRN
ncbi:conserved hypothetical protein [Ricinus communis]|uniref:Uncharacterized protein n=1 Tax=Ricinus communis TaxID=3988 RepID=B9RWZ2_RICCO|nr:conserved hypothetical protein [Ricinus communis]